MSKKKQTEEEMVDGEISDVEYAQFCIAFNQEAVKVQKRKAKKLRARPAYDPAVNEAFARAAEAQAAHHQQIADILASKMPTVH